MSAPPLLPPPAVGSAVRGPGTTVAGLRSRSHAHGPVGGGRGGTEGALLGSHHMGWWVWALCSSSPCCSYFRSASTLRFNLLVRCMFGSSAACGRVWQARMAAFPLMLWFCGAAVFLPLCLCVCGVGPGCISERDYGMCLPFNHLLCRLARTAVIARRVLCAWLSP